MKRMILVTLLLAGLMAFSSTGTAMARKPEPPSPPPDTSAGTVIFSEPVTLPNGQMGTVEIAVGQNDAATGGTRALASTVHERTCWAEFYVTILGVKTASYKLYQRFRYTGMNISYVFSPFTTVSSAVGWSVTNRSYGWFWVNRGISATAWASADVIWKPAGIVLRQWSPTIGIDFYGSGYCRLWGYV
ncbi:MAG: hypothetical protein A2Z11_03390 [Candidatus Woykebacteria bacterium RBG_16_43_9]|uniref:Uncharacterized protein n=1 Tax=Candidatus Woykebacteria bacterium RBG_16_43_9 TaxID=1802596 RepID=A0A1G1WH98_9BACT|nr:MAG: hypothetical protein A2Z11_03390 [Candidatus Woykebacteria bacterium RBG_16_43_9]